MNTILSELANSVQLIKKLEAGMNLIAIATVLLLSVGVFYKSSIRHMK